MSHIWVTAGDGVRLSVRVAGPDDAPTLVLVHGYPDNGSMWDGVVAELVGRFRCVVYDVRGAGESDKPRGRRSYELDRLAQDLESVIATVRPVGRVHRHAVAQFLRSGYILFFLLPLLPELLWRTGIMRRLGKALEPDAATPDTADGVHGLQLYRANIPRLLRPTPRAADIPVQVLAPTGDAFVGTPLQTEIERWVPDLRVRRVTGSHWIIRDKPGVIAAAAAELIDHVEGGAESRALRRSRVGIAKGRFAHKLVVVTGAGSGIGRATALAFADEGADVVITDINADTAAETANLLRTKGVSADEYTVDSSDGTAFDRFAQQVRDEHGVPDIVVNNAGIGMSGPFLDTSIADWDRVIDVNLWGVIHGCRAFAEQLVARSEGGHIVNVASMAAYVPSKVFPAYSTSKAAVLMLSECLRAELAAENIGVTAICPGLVRTDITGTMRFVGVDAHEQSRRRRATTRLAAKRGFGPDKVARDIVNAVERNVAVAPSTFEARAALVLSRLSPGILRGAAKLDLTAH